MIIAVQGTKSFNDYETFIRAMGVALSNAKNDGMIEVWSAGPHIINNFTAAFCNSTENYLKQKGYRVSFKKLPANMIEDNISDVSFFALLANKKEPNTKLLASAELAGIENGVFRY